MIETIHELKILNEKNFRGVIDNFNIRIDGIIEASEDGAVLAKLNLYEAARMLNNELEILARKKELIQ